MVCAYPAELTVPPSEVNAEALAGLSPEQRKARLGQALLPRVQNHQPILAVHITVLLLELSDAELLTLLENDARLEQKVEEATSELALRDETGRVRRSDD
ncbi:hypothetical protein CFP71_39205 [Amycolatopsis thailandensis]|uniref:PABC domain-containing protein n=1 Tax=Amycolatopsis thailandensis TaxID=589330 RepID=A0A229REN2_9PSEU|nr:hypothetical protein CFP71_39205 [Amycolatopsis thailandensis]